MNVFVAVVHDRHLDQEVSVHLSRNSAIEWARNYMREHVARQQELVEEDNDGFWYMSYIEEDNAFVVESEINE